MKTSLKNAELVNTVIRKMMTIMFIAGKEMKKCEYKPCKEEHSKWEEWLRSEAE